MAEKLKIDGATLTAGVENIRYALDAFEQTSRLTDEIADAAGGAHCPKLPGVLRDASSSWSVHREQLAKTLEALGNQLANCIEVFGDTDKEIAKGMQPQPPVIQAPR